jgi:hypothetical protein
MLNDKINKYKEVYSDLISAMAKLHNASMPFVINKGRETGFAVRKELRAIEGCARELKKLSQQVCKEAITNKRLEKARIQEEKRNKKNVRRNKSTKNTI